MAFALRAEYGDSELLGNARVAASQTGAPVPASADRHVVFLQGMPCSFFANLARSLQARGMRVTGIPLCVGDQLFWRGLPSRPYRGRESGFVAFFEAFLERESVTDIVLLGEQRRYHRDAVAVAKARGVRVIVTDFGYLRPDWITFEQDGMSANSRFPRNMSEIEKLAERFVEFDQRPTYRDSFVNMAAGDLAYSFANLFGGWLYPFYRRTDRRPHPIVYFPAMGLRLATERRRDERANAAFKAFVSQAKGDVFIFPLQLAHDFQIHAYSDFPSMAHAVERVLRSFASSAPKRARLVVKVHPHDPGLQNWRRLIARLSNALGVANRVLYVDGGSLQAMLPACKGMVTVNSTSGIHALQHGLAVKALGACVYDVPRLTFQEPLGQFWKKARPPREEDVRKLVAALAATVQIKGVFFSRSGREAAVRNAIARLSDGTVGVPVTADLASAAA